MISHSPQQSRADKLLAWSLFSFISLAAFAVGFYISYTQGYMHSDSVSRVANAFYVLYSRNPHLGAIGFVWTPLPSLLDLIVLLLYPLFPALASHALAAVVVSSIFSGLAAMLLYKTGIRYGLPKWLTLSIVILYSLNPFIFLFGVNGLSDSPYLYFLLYAMIQFTDWMERRDSTGLVKAGFALALAFWTRYEAVPVGFAMACAVFVVIWFIFGHAHPEESRKLRYKQKYHHIEATWILLLLPAVFSGLIWIFFNYTIMHNPFYFLNSEYSNVAQSESLKDDANFEKIFNSPILALLLCMKKTAWFSAPLIGVILLRMMNKRLFKWDIVVLLLVFCSIPALQFLLLLNSSSFAWFRYFMYVYPITVAWLPYELSKVKINIRNCAVVLTSLVVTVGLLTYALTNPLIAPDENTFLTYKQGRHIKSIELDRSVAKWLDENLQKDTILTDSAASFMIIVNSKYPKRFMITSDYDFRDAVSDPKGNGVDYILIPRLPVYSTINKTYPNLFEHGSEFATFYKSFEDPMHRYEWRLYKVVKGEQTIEGH
ncbi:glycosyltransferase family 39 protein [Paenibacillus sp. BC26]|uniref:ArnT family glycosyltransferase n=1 Tax=Paenibacillus sp. BC26 TaxID=1881032 RepID=UPI0008F0D6B9|nr:glycosyltransferase family 39 protein [Paenibacillus sp. BC26]SFT20746.1 Dolichyl-phosphate-mannose-protein mannosyltransferase [Paenibacillus sp. BC26]